MLTNKTKVILEELDEIMAICMKQLSMGAFANMGMDELLALQKCASLMERTKELAIEQAEMMDSMNQKLDTLLRLMEKRP